MTLSIILTCLALAFLIGVVLDYSHTTVQIKKLVKSGKINQKIEEYNNEIKKNELEIAETQREITDLEKLPKKHRAKKLQKHLARLKNRREQIKGAKENLEKLSQEITNGQPTDLAKLREVRRDLANYLKNRQR